MIVSTLDALFHGKKELFKGLAIEKCLGLDMLAPRPVIRLDMSETITSAGLEVFERSLAHVTASAGEELGLDAPRDLPAKRIFSEIIRQAKSKSGQGVAILIDEYDWPLINLMSDINVLNSVRMILREYYATLKSQDEFISFIFVTGISKNSQTGILSAANNLTDISLEPQFGTICGFTHEELVSNFGDFIEEAAEISGKSKELLLKGFKNYYNGFCFDGINFVYNQYSILHDFRSTSENHDLNYHKYWFESRSQPQVAQFLRDKHLTVEEFRSLEIPTDFARQPGELTDTPPCGYLYQAGYLSLRLSEPNGYILDYPNQEVLEGMSRLLMANFLGDSLSAQRRCGLLLAALEAGDIDGAVDQFNYLISEIPYDDFIMAEKRLKWLYPTRLKLIEGICRSNLRTFLRCTGALVEAEVHGSLGRTDLVAKAGGRAWVIELKTCQGADGGQKTAQAALDQALANACSLSCQDLLVVGMAIDGEQRLIAAWKTPAAQGSPAPAFD